MQSPLINPLKSALINPLINPFGGGSVPTISPANFTFSRASAAYDPLGILYPSGVPRIYGTQPWQGLMVEEGTSNLLPSGSDTFSTASGWGSPDVLTITPGQSDPFGGNNAYRIQGTGLGGSTYKLYITVTGRANPHTEATSLWIKKNNGNARFNDTTVTNGIEATTNFVKAVLAQSAASANAQIIITTSAASDVLDITVFQPKIEAKTYVTSYMPPGATRAAEAVTVPGSYLNPAQGTIEILCSQSAITKRVINGSYQKIFTLIKADDGVGMQLYHDAASANWGITSYNNAGAGTAATFADSATPNGISSISCAYSSTVLDVLANGVLVATINNPNLPTVFKLFDLGHYAGASYLNSQFYDACISNVSRTDLDLTSRAAFAARNGYFPNDGDVTWKLKR